MQTISLSCEFLFRSFDLQKYFINKLKILYAFISKFNEQRFIYSLRFFISKSIFWNISDLKNKGVLNKKKSRICCGVDNVMEVHLRKLCKGLKCQR